MRALLTLAAAAAFAAAGCVPPPPERPPPDPREAPYNRACALALEGKANKAMDLLEETFRDGFGSIGFDHLAADPDLALLHGTPRWEALLRRLSWNEDASFLAKSREGRVEGPAPLIVEIEDVSGLPDMSRFPDGSCIALPFPPYQEGPNRHRWTTRLDSGERAAEKIAFVTGNAVRDLPIRRKVLLASGDAEVRVAWEVLLREPDLFDAAVLDGPEPPAWVLDDRGKEKVKTRILPASPSLEAALAEALR